MEIEQVVVRKKRNMLYDIFKKDNNSGKRKLSPEEETVQKFRRMTVSNDTSPVLKPADLKSKFRTRRCSSLDKKRLKELAEDKKKGVKQPLITQLFKGDLNNSEEGKLMVPKKTLCTVFRLCDKFWGKPSMCLCVVVELSPLRGSECVLRKGE